MASGVRLVRECRWWQRWLVLFLCSSDCSEGLTANETRRARRNAIAVRLAGRSTLVGGSAAHVRGRACHERGEVGDDGDDSGSNSRRGIFVAPIYDVESRLTSGSAGGRSTASPGSTCVRVRRRVGVLVSACSQRRGGASLERAGDVIADPEVSRGVRGLTSRGPSAH